MEGSEPELQSSILSRRGNSKRSYWRCVAVLFKREFGAKVRSFSSIAEMLGAILIPFIIGIIFSIGKEDFPESLSPGFDNKTQLGYELAAFMNMNGEASFFMLPNSSNVRDLVDDLHMFIDRFNYTLEYVQSYNELENKIYKTGNNGVGIHWVNSEAPDALDSPNIQVYYQSVYGSPSKDLFRICRLSIAKKSQKFSLALFDVFSRKFGSPGISDSIDLNMTLMIFSVWPIFFSSMPDIQTILDDRGNKVFTLMNLMGCPESAYWLVMFTTTVVMCIVPYIVNTFIVCFWAGLIGTSIGFIFTLSLLFIISHICFMFFLVSLLKTPEQGRQFIALFLVLSIFTLFTHHYFTLSEDNIVPYASSIFSIVPFSAFQMLLSDLCTKQISHGRAMGWDDYNLKSMYPISRGVTWLLIDAVVYFVLFLFFNSVMSRPTGYAPLGWLGFFSLEKWKKLFWKKQNEVYGIIETSNFLKVNNLSKIYNGITETRALNDLNFYIKKGEIVVVIGPNGAGKSTLINILSGTLEPTSGSIEIMGNKETNDFTDLNQFLGICFQENVLIDTMTLKQNVELFATFRGLDPEEIEDFITKYSFAFQLNKVLDSYAKDLSGGQKRKLCIMLSFLGDPSFIIMDEPVAGVDVQSRITIWKVISSLRNTSIMITSHALDEAETISQRIMIVSQGSIPFTGSSTELRCRYKCGYNLRVELSSHNIDDVLHFVQQFIPEAILSEVGDAIRLPVCEEVVDVLHAVETEKEKLGIITYSFHVEQLENMLIKMIQQSEGDVNPHPKTNVEN